MHSKNSVPDCFHLSVLKSKFAAAVAIVATRTEESKSRRDPRSREGSFCLEFDSDTESEAATAVHEPFPKLPFHKELRRFPNRFPNADDSKKLFVHAHL